MYIYIYIYICIELFHQPTLMHYFLYSLTICLLHYYPPHVSSINMLIFRRKNCIHTASCIFALCKRLHSTLVESGMLMIDEIILYYDARSKKRQYIYIYTMRSKSSRTKAIKTIKKRKEGIFSVYLFKIGSIRCNIQVSTCFQLLHGVRKVFCGILV